MMQRARFWILIAFLSCCGGILQAVYAQTASNQPIIIAVDIPPVAALVATLTDGLGEVRLLLTKKQSHHHLQLSPSQSEILAQAQLAIIVSRDLMPELAHAIEQRDPALPLIEILRLQGPGILPYRPSESRILKENDPHIWLDPVAMQSVMTALRMAIAPYFPKEEDKLNENLELISKQLNALNFEIQSTTQNVQIHSPLPYASLHDSYQYFEHRYNLTALPPLQHSPEETVGAQTQMRRMKDARENPMRCILAEETTPLVKRLSDTTGATVIQLDPVWGLPEDTEQPYSYDRLIYAVAHTIARCSQPVQDSAD